MVGPGGFEFWQDLSSGRYLYIEMNPRFGAGCSGADFDEALGVPTAAVAYRVAMGLEPGTGWRQRDGVYFDRPWSDLMARRADGESPWRVGWEHARLALTNRVRYPFFAWRDPLPSLAGALGWWQRRLTGAGEPKPPAGECNATRSQTGLR